MFHANLDQASKRYNKHPNVAAIYTSLPKDEANKPERTQSPTHQPKVRDFAYDQLTTRDFIADFTDFGFRSHYRRVHNGDMLSKASVLAYETVPQSRLKEPSAELQALFPGFSDMNYYPPQSNALSTSENAITAPKNSKSSDVSGTTGADSIATSATTESLDEEEGNSDNRRPRGIRDDPLMLEVAVCMLRYINR